MTRHSDQLPTETRSHLKRFVVTRTFRTVVEAEKPFQALEMVRANPDAWDTDIIERAQILDEGEPT